MSPSATQTETLPAEPAEPAETWPRAALDRAGVEDLLGSGAVGRRADLAARRLGLGPVLDWLESYPGATWQDRWLLSGVEGSMQGWRRVPLSWMRVSGIPDSRQDDFFQALRLLIGVGVLRPSLRWLVAARFGHGSLARVMAHYRDPDGFARLRTIAEATPDMSRAAFNRSMYRAAILLATTGGLISDLTTDHVLEILDTEAEVQGKTVGATNLFYRLLRDMGVFDPDAPMTYRQLRTRGQRTPEQIIDRYQLRNRPIRDLLVDYLRERQPSLDYTSLESLAASLAGSFWSDIERHHPDVTTLDLPGPVADAWKTRLRTISKIIRNPDGSRHTLSSPRINYRECLTPVRAFYLDLAHWAVEDPARWAAWVVPSPVGAEEVDRRKDKRHRKSRMDSRTRERLPVLPVLVKTVNQRRITAAAALHAARATPTGQTFTIGGQPLRRVTPRRSTASPVWVEDVESGRRRDLAHEEEYAFWGWATVEILRETGIRIEELSELSHHSLVQYRVPASGEVVPLLQIAPSKTDAERLLVVSPELADVLAQIIHRVRANDGTIPAVPAYDPRERTWQPASPLLFQRRYGHERRAITISTLRQMLNAALDATGLTDSTGKLLRFTPHDFRRLFITDAILNGLPPHIAQVIAGHSDINTTIGYNTIYPDETIRAHRAFLARRRALRPGEEYRTPTEEEWENFLGHFQRRKVSLGTCARSFGTPCIHEHACVRCPMLWPDPAQRSRLIEIIDNLTDRIAEAKKERWFGEIDGLQISRAGAIDKLSQLDQRSGPVRLGMPAASKPPAESGGTPLDALPRPANPTSEPGFPLTTSPSPICMRARSPTRKHHSPSTCSHGDRDSSATAWPGSAPSSMTNSSASCTPAGTADYTPSYSTPSSTHAIDTAAWAPSSSST